MVIVGDCVTGDTDGGIVDIATGGPEGSSTTIVGDRVGRASPGGSVSIESNYTNKLICFSIEKQNWQNKRLTWFFCRGLT